MQTAAVIPACLSENEVLSLLRGTLAASGSVQEHIDTCEACQDLFACIASLGSGARPKSAPTERPAGSKVGRYRIVRSIGAGAMGIVYLAEDPDLGRRVALKMLRQQEGQERLTREAQALARVAHPNVIVVYEVGTFEGQVTMAMEFVEGESLTSWLSHAPRAVADILATFEQAGRGLAVAHAAGLVHRDFKPDNVLVGRDGRVRVVDFGLARQLAAPHPQAFTGEEGDDAFRTLTRTGAFMGTPAYMAPEQYEGAPADERSDQFSFAVSLYEALYEKRPFQAETLTGLMIALKRGAAMPPRDGRVPRHVESAVLRGLSLRREDRYPDIAALLTALGPRAKSRTLPLAIALVLAVGLALGLVSVMRARPAPSMPNTMVSVASSASVVATAPPAPPLLLRVEAPSASAAPVTSASSAPPRVRSTRTNKPSPSSSSASGPLMPTTP